MPFGKRRIVEVEDVRVGAPRLHAIGGETRPGCRIDRDRHLPGRERRSRLADEVRNHLGCEALVDVGLQALVGGVEHRRESRLARFEARHPTLPFGRSETLLASRLGVHAALRKNGVLAPLGFHFGFMSDSLERLLERGAFSQDALIDAPANAREELLDVSMKFIHVRHLPVAESCMPSSASTRSRRGTGAPSPPGSGISTIKGPSSCSAAS
jgi:hypothetical protein